MYSAGEEFEKTNNEGDVEEYTCLSNITVLTRIICTGTKILASMIKMRM